jgi:hypothetical protein
MKRQLALSCAILATLLGSLVAAKTHNSNTNTTPVEAFGKDSVATTELRAQLAMGHIGNWGAMHVRKAADTAVSIARATARVKRVHSRRTIDKSN